MVIYTYIYYNYGYIYIYRLITGTAPPRRLKYAINIRLMSKS